MSVIRTGPTKTYATGWELAFGKTEKKSRAAGTTVAAKSAKTKAKKQSSLVGIKKKKTSRVK
jgi:hypothetical protein